MAEQEKHYWQLIEPILDQINIYDGPDIFLGTFATAKPPTGAIYAAHFAQSEICNGGFHQLFSNSTGVLSPEAVEGFRLIGMDKTADLLKAAMEALGNPFPRDRAARQKTLKNVPEEKLNQLDRVFFKEIDQENGGFEAAANAFVSSLGN
jgi:hypothetical protein